MNTITNMQGRKYHPFAKKILGWQLELQDKKAELVEIEAAIPDIEKKLTELQQSSQAQLQIKEQAERVEQEASAAITDAILAGRSVDQAGDAIAKAELESAKAKRIIQAFAELAKQLGAELAAKKSQAFELKREIGRIGKEISRHDAALLIADAVGKLSRKLSASDMQDGWSILVHKSLGSNEMTAAIANAKQHEQEEGDPLELRPPKVKRKLQIGEEVVVTNGLRTGMLGKVVGDAAQEGWVSVLLHHSITMAGFNPHKAQPNDFRREEIEPMHGEDEVEQADATQDLTSASKPRLNAKVGRRVVIGDVGSMQGMKGTLKANQGAGGWLIELEDGTEMAFTRQEFEVLADEESQPKTDTGLDASVHAAAQSPSDDEPVIGAGIEETEEA